MNVFREAVRIPLASPKQHVLHVQISRNFLHTIPVSVAWPCSDNTAINYYYKTLRYVGLLQALWITSCFHIMGPVG